MKRSLLILMVLLCAVGFVAASASALTYRVAGEPTYKSDDDPNDTIDFADIVGWEVIFTVPESPVLGANRIDQGGSLTTYQGTTIDSVTLTFSQGSRVVVATDLASTLTLWDRPIYQGGQDIVKIWHTTQPTGWTRGIFLDWDAVIRQDAMYDQMFNRGTPGPNTPLPGFLPVFDTAAQAEPLYHDSMFTLKCYGDDFGSGIFRGDMTVMEVVSADPIPEPATMAMTVMAIAGLGRYTRKRLAIQ